MGISNTLQRIGFTSGADLFYGALQSVDLQVKNTCKGGISKLLFRWLHSATTFFF